MKRLKRHPDAKSLAVRVLIIFCLIVVGTTGLAFGLAFFTGICGLSNIEVHGNQYLSADFIRGASGLKMGENLLMINVDKVAENLKNNNWVDEVYISRRLPQTVEIRIREKSPVARVSTGGALFLVDGKAYVITNEIPPNFSTIPAVFGGENLKIELGESIRNKKVKEAIELIEGMPAKARVIIELCNPFDGRGFVFNTKAGFQIIYGDYKEIEKKNELIEAMLIDIETNHRHVSYIDIRVTDSPVTGQ